jgi:hypothetical protein
MAYTHPFIYYEPYIISATGRLVKQQTANIGGFQSGVIEDLSLRHWLISPRRFGKNLLCLSSFRVGFMVRGAPKEVLPDCSPLQTPQNQNFKNVVFVYLTISKGLCDFLFSRNLPLKSADDLYIRILKNKLIKFIKNKKIRHCD